MELWNPKKIELQLLSLQEIAEHVVISGGLAWHLMSPPHEEIKTVHDHKDVDIFVFPDQFSIVVAKLKELGFEKVWTKYDGISKDFYRYSLVGEPGDKVLLDVFVQEIPYIQVEHLLGSFNVVEPSYLLSLYEHTHTSKDCVAVKAATKLIAAGISPVGREELIGGNHVSSL
jgi:hypothetical protein